MPECNEGFFRTLFKSFPSRAEKTHEEGCMIRLDTALQGLDRAEKKLEATAQRLARLPASAESAAPEDSVSLSDEMVALMEARSLFAVNTRVIRTANEMEQDLLDMFG